MTVTSLNEAPPRGGNDADELARVVARAAKLGEADAASRDHLFAQLDARDEEDRKNAEASLHARLLDLRADEVLAAAGRRTVMWGATGGGAVVVGFLLGGPFGGLLAALAAVAAGTAAGPDPRTRRRVLR